MTSGAIIGVNFSQRRAAELGLDPLETFAALINDLRVRCFRLSLYWDEIQPEPTRYDFSSIHRYLDLAESRRARVLLTVGLRAPYAPWEHPPHWLALPASRAEAAVQTAGLARPRVLAHLLLMLERSVSLLADYSVIEAWQLEVAPPLASGSPFDSTMLEKEYAAVAGCDPRNRLLVASSAAWSPLELTASATLAHADVLGQEVYRNVQGAPRNRVLGLPASSFAWLGLRAALVRLRGRRFWLTSLPAEPSTDCLDLDSHSDAGELQDDLVRYVHRAARLGAERVYLSGGEWWLRQRLAGAPGYWEAARSLFTSAPM